MPDLSTRVFLRQLHEAFPQVPVLGLVDWNPSGMNFTHIHCYTHPAAVELDFYRP